MSSLLLVMMMPSLARSMVVCCSRLTWTKVVRWARSYWRKVEEKEDAWWLLPSPSIIIHDDRVVDLIVIIADRLVAVPFLHQRFIFTLIFMVTPSSMI